jgi:Tol biopolymer transport system component
MFGNDSAARRTRKRVATVVGLLAMVAIGLTACRGFFGQGPLAFLVIEAGGDTEVPVTVTFDMSESSDADGTIVSYELDVGDGTVYEGTDITVAILHPYLEARTYTVILTLVDNDGRIGMDLEMVTIGPAMITFASNRSGQYDIYRMLADGSGEGAVNVTGDDELFPDLVRPTRSKIVYAAEDGLSWNIWTMDITGGGLSPLTSQTASNQIQPSWTHDGGQIVYASNAAQTPSATTWELYRMESDGTDVEQITTQSPSWAIAPACSPSSVHKDVVFVSNKGATGDSSVWILYEDGTAKEIYDPGLNERAGDASPAFAMASVALSLPAGAGISRPSWSPDGTLIVVSVSDAGQTDLWVLDPYDDTYAELLEDYIDEEYGVTATDINTTYNEFSPYWLEDRTGIAFVSDRDGDYQIYRVTFATADVEPLTETDDNILPAATKP